MRASVRWLWGAWRRLGTRRQRLVAWVLVSAVFVYGLWRVETTASRAEDAAAEAHAATTRLTEVVEQIEAVRVDRCLDGRGGTRAAIVRVVDQFTDLDAAEVAEVGDAVDDELPVAACTQPPP